MATPNRTGGTPGATEKTAHNAGVIPANDDDVKIVVSHTHYDLLFRAALGEACRSMNIVKGEMRVLQERADLHGGTSSEDIHDHLRIMREDLAVLDALGWPQWRRRAELAADHSSAASAPPYDAVAKIVEAFKLDPAAVTPGPLFEALADLAEPNES